MRLAGTLGIGDWREPAFNLTFKAVDAQLINNDRGEVHANADLTITGPFAHARVDGTVQVVHGVLYIPESTGKTLVGAGDPQLFSVVDTSVAMERELFPAESPLFKGLEMNVTLSVDARHVGPLTRRERRALHGGAAADQRRRRCAHADRRGERGPRRVHLPQPALQHHARLGAVHRHARSEPDAAGDGGVPGEDGGECDESSGCSSRGTAAEAAHLARERRSAAALAERPVELSRLRREHGLAAAVRQRTRCRHPGVERPEPRRRAARRHRTRRRPRRAGRAGGTIARRGRAEHHAGRLPGVPGERDSTSSCAPPRSRRGAT